MIALVEGCHIRRIVGRAASQPNLFTRVVIASPFIDDCGAVLIHRLYRAARTGFPTVEIVTTPPGGALVHERCPPRYGFRVETYHHLHAKLYLLVGKNQIDHEAVVTSANLTAPGMTTNIELGVRITSSSPAMIDVIERLADHLLNRPHQGPNQ